jgi:nucleoside-diphosphate-sugar epimerase
MTSELRTYAFVLGTGRCGSTLIHELLARHEGVGFLSNLDDRLRVDPVEDEQDD